MKYSNKTYVVSHEQIRDGDISDFLNRFDPARLSTQELAGLCGTVRVRIEHARAWPTVFTEPQSREFFRKLHASFQHWGFFLRLHPVRARKISPALLDAEMFVVIGFCQADVITARWDRSGHQVFFIRTQQFEAFLAEADLHVAELGHRAGLTPQAIAYRRKLVAKTAKSFLRLCSLPPISRTP